MPFYLYNVVASGSQRTFSQVAPVPLAGNTGPLAALALKNAAGFPNKWHASSADVAAQLLRMNASLGPATDVVIDLKPDAKLVSLYRLLDVWGFSSHGWSPVALHLEALAVDRSVDEPLKFKHSFPAGPECESVGEFLYLQGAGPKDKWTWGRNGQVNGTLLWPDAFRYLAGELGEAIDLWANGGHPLNP